MAKQNRRTKAKPNKSKQPQVKPTAIPRQPKAQAALVELSDESDRTLQAQADRLGDEHLPTVQRQELAAQIGREQGNQHLQQVVALLKEDEADQPGVEAGQTGEEGTATTVVQRQATANIQALDEMLNRWNVPEEDVISLLGRLTTTEKNTVLTGGYKQKIASAMNLEEMVRAVTNLDPPLHTKLDWVRAAVSALRTDYSDIRTLITNAPQDQKNVLKTTPWRDYFVGVCTNRTMAQAVVDLGFDLATKLDWMLTEGTNFELIASVIRTTPEDQLSTVAENRELMNRLRSELSADDYQTVREMLTQGLLWQGTTEEQTDTGNRYQAWLRHTRGEITISKEVKFIEEGTFRSGGFERLKQRLIQAVTDYLSRKYKVKIESSAGRQVGDGTYPIVVQVTDNDSADYPLRLHGGAHGRSGVRESGGDIYELGQATETSVPDVALAHESAHMILGASDEYANPRIPARTLYTDHSLMGNFYNEGMGQAEIKARHFQYLVEYISRYFPDRTISIVRLEEAGDFPVPTGETRTA